MRGKSRLEVTPGLVEQFRKYHSRNSATFHIVLDDRNFEPGHAAYCLESIRDDDEGSRLGVLLCEMSTTQRRKLERLVSTEKPTK